MDGLITANQLVERLGSDGLVVVDCRFNLMDPDAGRLAWEAGHIPGAYYADLDWDLASPRTPISGRHPLPDPAEFARLLGSWGVTPDTDVVGYDDAGGAVAARLWWLLRWVGHTRVALLDGGWTAWQQAGFDAELEQPTLQAGHYPVRPGSMPTVNVAEVEQGLVRHELTLIDARDAGRFAGKAEPIDTKAGHIPGSINRPFQENLNGEGRFRPAKELASGFAALLGDSPGAVACSCGSGVTACHNLFAMELAGMREPAALYVGSWSEWIQSPARPIAPEPVT